MSTSGRPGPSDSYSGATADPPVEPWPDLRRLLDGVATGELTADDAHDVLQRLPFGHLGFARVDHHRWIRTGLAEAVYGPGKTPDQCAEIVSELLSAPISAPVILTRADHGQTAAALKRNPDGRVIGTTIIWNVLARRAGRVVVVSAGTGDLAVADECQATLTAYGYCPDVITDIGVAGLHRLLNVVDRLQDVDVIVVIAGMEGALPSVIGGLTAAPIIAVPTSVGYGSSLHGHTALLGMLASCSQGIAVMGIDNGFGAACAARRLLSRIEIAADG